MHITKMDRPFWIEPQHLEVDKVTVLICQNQTPDRIRLCIESLLTFYPTIKILVVTSEVHDESYWYLKYKEARNPNIKIFERGGNQNHGDAMHDGITGHIKTRYFLTMDSDTIVKRGGWIELMVREIDREDVFSIGTLNLTTWSNDAIGNPKNEADALLYTHPSCSMYDKKLYEIMSAEGQLIPDANNVTVRPQFCNHGAPCWSIMKAAKVRQYEVLGFPVEDYVMHLSGYSWTGPIVAWKWDYDVHIRPMVTFISEGDFIYQDDYDFDILIMRENSGGNFVTFNEDSTDSKPVKINNKFFSQRLRITGDYVCLVNIGRYIPSDLVRRLRLDIIANPNRDVIVIDNFEFYTRKYYQSKIAWL